MSTRDFLNFKELSKEIGTNYNMDINGKKILWNDIEEIHVDKENPFIFKLRTAFNNTNYQRVKVIII